MILRKPYAFLIKYFRLIHLVISLLIIFLISKTSNILSFLKASMNNDIYEFTAANYINFFVYLAVIFIVGLAVTIIVLMRKKEKPLLFYIFTTVGYVVFFIGFVYVGSIINRLQFEFLDRKTIGLARDITRFMLIGEWIFLVFYIVRTLGFDIKKFDFKKDLQELDIDVSDNEEFELISPVDTDKVKKIGRRRLRELKYYYVENKLFIIIILSVVTIFLGFKILNNIDFGTVSKFKEKEVINLDNYYTLMVEDSYITTKDANDKDIAINDKFFLIIKFTINSSYNGQFTLDTNKFIVTYRDEKFIADRNYYSYFTNYGVGYKNQKISLNDNKTYILVYRIPNDYKNRKLRLEYEYRYDNSGDKAKMIKKIVKLDPEIVS